MCTMQSNDRNSGTVKGKYMHQLRSTFIRMFILRKLDIFEDFKIGMIKLN